MQKINTGSTQPITRHFYIGTFSRSVKNNAAYAVQQRRCKQNTGNRLRKRSGKLKIAGVQRAAKPKRRNRKHFIDIFCRRIENTGLTVYRK